MGPLITSIGLYTLGQRIETAAGLREFSNQDYSLAEAAGIKRMLDSERIFNAEPIEWAGASWDKPTIASTRGKIYKICLQFNTENSKLAKTVFRSTVDLMASTMGAHSQHPLLSKQYVWDREEGNAIIYMASMMGWHSVNVFFTAHFISEQMRATVSSAN